MNKLFRKTLVILPVGILTLLYFRAHFRSQYLHADSNRLLFLALTVFLLYTWIILNVVRWKQDRLFNMLVQSSFLLYMFMVLTLTGYFILFREVSGHGWYNSMLTRVQHRDHVNLKAFQMFRIYKITDKQIVGNFIMLLPFGIYLPLLYRRMNNFLSVLLAAFLTSVTIELLQLATRFRSADVDDVILNTSGAVVGFLLLRLILTIKRQTGTGTLETT